MMALRKNLMLRSARQSASRSTQAGNPAPSAMLWPVCRFSALFAVIAIAGLPMQPSAAEEPPALTDAVEAGLLPPLAERLPAVPRRDLPDRAGWVPGRYGGTLRTLSRGGRDPRDLVIFGYARLVVWEPDPGGGFRLVPDILEAVEIEDGRGFTLRLRPGHRWSDGQPFTSEDFRFWWEDVANNPALSPSGPPRALMAGDEAPSVTFPDATTVRFRWSRPNARFLPALAATSPPFIYRPAHYLKPFHADYAPRAELDAAAAAEGQRDWAARFQRLDHPFRLDNPDRPTLQPWRNSTAPPAERFVGLRNPYFHRVDAQGRQLPYIDRVTVARTQARLIPAQAAAGQVGLQARGLSFRDVALLKQAEAAGKLRLRLWPIGRGAQLALYPNLNAKDPVLRALLGEANFRRALSLAIDRAAINQVVYQSLARPGGNAPLPASPLYDAAREARWSGHDPTEAARLLDGLGLEREESSGLRRMADGRNLTLVVESGDTDPAETDILELIADDWRAVGVELLIRSTSRQNFRSRVRSGEAAVSLFYGLANGLANAATSPAELAPTSDRQNNWPRWGLHYQTGGRGGAAPDLPAAARLLSLYEAWSEAASLTEQSDAWRDMLAIHADQLFTIGLIAEVLQPVASDRNLRNLPDRAYYLYEPGAYFGVYRPDTFWFE